MKKKGLSTVVTTLIIILLVLVAIGIIWVVIANVISQGSEQISIDKFTTNLKIKNANVDNSNNSIDVDVKRNAGKGDLEGLKFIFNDGANSEISDQDNINLVELGERRFNFVLNNLNVDNVQTVSIAPIFKSGSGEKIYGGIVATYRIKGTGVLGTCVPDCTGKVCGSDGCIGTCSTGCDSGETCSIDGTHCNPGVNPCSLTSASWSATNVVQGNSVDMNAVGTQCNTALNYSVYEADVGSDTFIDSWVVLSLTKDWTAQWMDDGSGNDPQYYFTVTVVDNPSMSVQSSNQLTVAQGAQTCAAQGGDICITGETCSGNWLTATDSTTCCDVTCTAPAYPNSYVIRDIPTSVAAGSQVTVTLDVNTQPSTERLFAFEERIPSGWTVVSNDFSGGTNDTLILITYSAQGFCCINTNYHFTYTLQAPSPASQTSYTFDGIYVFESSVVTANPPTCGNDICEVSSDLSQSEPNSADPYYCPQDCSGEPIFGPTTVTVA